MLSFIQDLVVEPFNPFYVYAHYRLSDGKLFYIGKGKGKRAWTKHNRNTYWNNVVNKHGFSVVILAQDLTETDAYELEKQAIELFRIMYCPLTNIKAGGIGRVGYSPTEETKLKMSRSAKGRKNLPHVIDAIRKSTSRSFVIVSPTNEVINGFNLSNFCRENKLSRECIRDVIIGKQASHRGWTQYKGKQ